MLKRGIQATALAACLSTMLIQSGAAAGLIFIDPSARIDEREHVRFGELVYIAPFAQLLADDDGQDIRIGNESNVQDNVLLNATRRERGRIRIGEQVILAHGAAVVGPASVGRTGDCHETDGEVPTSCPTFVGFNAVIDGAIVQKDSMVLSLARVAPGVTIPSGVKVLPGKYVRTQAEVAVDAVPVTAADRAFMEAVIEVNVEFVRGYNELKAEDRSNVYGINVDPSTTFNPGQDLPRMAGRLVRDPSFRNRIIGDVDLEDSRRSFDEKTGRNISLRADEGDPFIVGRLRRIGNRHTMHALEFSRIDLGDGASLGFHSVVHGGGPIAPEQPTAAGRNLRLGNYSALFRGFVGDDVTIGHKSLVQGTALPSGTTVPDCTVIVDGVTSPPGMVSSAVSGSAGATRL